MMDMKIYRAKHLTADGRATSKSARQQVQGGCEGLVGWEQEGGGRDVQQKQQQGTLQVQGPADSGADTKGGSGHDCAKRGVLPCACPHAGFPSTLPPLA